MNLVNSITMTLAFDDAATALRAYDPLERLAAGLFAAGDCSETRVRLCSDEPKEEALIAAREMCEEEEEFHLRFHPLQLRGQFLHKENLQAALLQFQ